MDARYEELFRTRAAEELDRLEVLNEEYEWRTSTAAAEDSSRIKWGYDPEAEMSMRRDTSLTTTGAITSTYWLSHSRILIYRL